MRHATRARSSAPPWRFFRAGNSNDILAARSRGVRWCGGRYRARRRDAAGAGSMVSTRAIGAAAAVPDEWPRGRPPRTVVRFGRLRCLLDSHRAVLRAGAQIPAFERPVRVVVAAPGTDDDPG